MKNPIAEYLDRNNDGTRKEKTLQEKLNELEAERAELLKEPNAAYYNRKSPHYFDNDRFSWAVSLINKNFDRKANELRAAGQTGT